MSSHDPPGQVIKCVLECYEVSRENLTYNFEHIELIERDQMRIYKGTWFYLQILKIRYYY